MNDLLVQFVAEARDLTREAGEDLMALERQPDAEETINRLFRSVHTLKGSSGLFKLPALTRVLHVLEDIFQAIRDRLVVVTAETVDLGLKTLDQVGQWIDHLDQNDELPETADAIATSLIVELRGKYGRRPGELLHRPVVKQQEDADVEALLPDLRRLFRQEALRSAAEAADGGSVALIAYRPEENCFFRGEDPLHLAIQIPGLQALVIEPRQPWRPLSALDPFTANLDFHALSTASRTELDQLFRYVTDQVTITALSGPLLLHGIHTPPPDVVHTLLREQIDMLALDAPEEAFAGRIGSAARVAANALHFAKLPDVAATIEKAHAAALAARQAAPLQAAIMAVLQAPVHAAAPSAKLAENAAAPDPPERAAVAERVMPRTLRVDQEKVDLLMNLIGELVVAKNSLPFLARKADQQHGLRDLGREIKDQYGVIDRIAQELQAAVMSVRMMPVGQVFQRFPRLVRDLSRKLGKEVELVIEGEQTEADKNVIENLFDPLLHMVRNSLDHGVEPPADRIARGKPATAMVKLLARHDGDQVVLEVVDDGRGIDPEVIKRTAYERGLLDESRLATITDQEATMLVFAAGFSTAASISDVSGRGVGMDVVRNAVESAGGRIVMNSVKGVGTTVRLNLPLSMAVSRVMTVALGSRLFGIPMDLIHGTVKVARRDIVRIKGGEAVVLRDRVVPLVHLARLLELPEAETTTEEVAVLVVRVEGQTIGLGISVFGEGMEVILKPLEGMLATIRGYAGTALLGDGRVLLVLDLKELLP